MSSGRRELPGDPRVRELVRQAGGVSRRRFLAGAAGAAGAGALLAACGTAGSTQAGEDGGGAGGALRWANWTQYLDQDEAGTSFPTLAAFEEQSGIAVDYAEDVEDNDSFYGKVSRQLENGQDIGYDVVTLTDWMTARWIRQEYVAELDKSRIPNAANILPNLAGVDFDDGRRFSLTWQSGFAGIAWDTQAIPDGLRSVSDLWDPRYKGRVEVLSEMRDTIGLIMLENGTDPSGGWSTDDWFDALDVVQRHLDDGQIRQVRGNSYVQDLASGDAVACIAWSGDITSLNYEYDGRFAFAIPEAGGTLWSDNLMVPHASPRRAQAEELFDYYYDPQVAAEVAAWVNYITPVQGAQEAMAGIDPALAEDPMIFPTDEILSQVRVFRTLTPAEEERYNGQFLTAIGA
ncbi:spermidine/putrescine ABC transporter substrate-binding protein [Cellulomonas sp. zg-ZUI222]|uniref:Spermidine/putrescine ABC transporter substrate-binding protein n=1 Tax=Cellulomonas wangleii TaxID=2816956 RepID=A0ABX8DA38_9CELL|nr:spermidine/putrescine ABC transporter substrate-binding protein [Cellulomonas wangleii]MBO0921377.1 spermidine/putrescine ABC transporter substrate-binding protein [Cellulomonas wangleii]MBO0925794.1 spermidine/putrescine ABC transporter substrate-binding protein [Cellulomonas wangleii]QVI63685.1 spermidine/putrescine ABC transporter substrate-binding protein [Cellulomonas wangleii]